MNRSVEEEAKSLYYDRKYSFKQIGNKLGYSRQAIYNLAVRKGWEIRDKKEAAEVKVARNAAKVETLDATIHKLFRQGWTSRRIARTLHVSMKSVKEIYINLPELDRRASSYRGKKQKIKNDELSKYLIKVWDILGQPNHPPTIHAYNKIRIGLAEHKVKIPHAMTYVQRWGSWHAACLDIFKDYPNVQIEHTTNFGSVKKYDELQMLNALKLCYDEIGHIPSIVEYDKWRKTKDIDFPSSGTILKRLFGWLNALKLLEEELKGN